MPVSDDDRDAGNPQRKTEPTPPAHPRPRPQYGEYATPQDQANAIATSLPPVSPVLLPPERSRPAPVAPISPTPPHDRSAPPPDPATRITDPNGSSRDTDGDAAPSTAVPARRWDFVISVGLLVYGVLNVISGLFLYADMGAYLDEVFATLGVGQYTDTGLERPIGIAIAASNVVSFALGAWFTVKRLKAGKVAFWIPIVAGAIATVVSAIFLQVLVSNDPAMTAYITRLIGG